MDIIVSYAIALVILFVLIKVFSLPFKILWNGIIGGLTLWVVNLIGALFGVHIEITVITALIAGFFGVPGVLVLVVWQVLK
ncbi:MAG TPA: pro-sigmaK processing inhibitor BofA family protein [Candidatus Avacidaminococcus intestinavium]|uniref:Pro-sigmaK processing inhibitor BofA family protein n=1 Tax=Candidatus Avacidaminococcus intestinavium TaxID=2840684 RepID=A0A9D1SLP7_9FIRM|nr:pro-sigmaK processing inhibitor BofA family protein [Candidatus Avacidaminococcus intestinavium]